MILRFASIILFSVLFAGTVGAQQTRITDYDSARDRVFYRLYAKVPQYEATDIYCGLKFRVDPAVLDLPENQKTGNPAPWMTAEHAYAAQWMADHFQCGNRKTCNSSQTPPDTRSDFNHAVADLHNLWPAVGNLNSARGDRLFGELKDKSKRTIKPKGQEKTFECDYQQQGETVQPRRIARGNLARSIFYMCKEYGLPVDPAMLVVLKKWNKQDKPTQGERRRNDKIESFQGTRNPFIDDPLLAETLVCPVT